MRTIVVAVATVIIFAMSGVAMASNGASIFKSKCSACHGAKAQGMPGMAPATCRDRFYQGRCRTDKVYAISQRPRGGCQDVQSEFPLAMPKLGISAADADAIVEYLKSL